MPALISIFLWKDLGGGEGLPLVQALFPHTKRENVHTVGCKKPKTHMPPSLPKEKMRNTHSQTPAHESSQLNSPEAIMQLLLGKAAHSSATAQVQPCSCENPEAPSPPEPHLHQQMDSKRAASRPEEERAAPRPLSTKLPPRHVRNVYERLNRPHLQVAEHPVTSACTAQGPSWPRQLPRFSFPMRNLTQHPSLVIA